METLRTAILIQPGTVAGVGLDMWQETKMKGYQQE